jgi:uncharacterized protein YcsI (UPF0317 family)
MMCGISVEGDFLSFCDQRFIKMCPVLDGCEVVNTSNLGRKVKVIEKIIV